jgi:leucyl aminopeptidase (aminopeptidase T)
MTDAPSGLQRDAARSIVTKYLRVRPGENVIVESWDHTLRMASAMVDEARHAGGKLLLVHNDEDAWWRAIGRGQTKLLGESSAPEWAALKAADVYVNFWGPGDAGRIESDTEDALDAAFAWNWPWYAVARKVGLRGVRMTEGFVTEGRAKQWGLDRARWEANVLRACLTDPAELGKAAARLRKAISTGKKVRITHSNGTDVEVGLAGLAPRVFDGRPHPWTKGSSRSGMIESIPAGRLEVALDSKTAEGSIHANRRTNIWWNWQAGGTLEFAGGRLASYSFEHGAEEFGRRFKNASAGKDRASVLKFGLNPSVKDVPNLEYCERGCVTLQIGGNRGLGGTNRSNFFTWFSLAGAEVSIDGTPVLRAGRFV